MGSYEPGSRVFAVRNTDDTTVYAYGAGVYVGDFPRPGWEVDEAYQAMCEETIRKRDADPLDLSSYHARLVADGEISQEEASTAVRRAEEHRLADMARPMPDRVDELLQSLSLNPKIVLDDGAGVVWGCECWWAPEDHPRWVEMRRTRRVVTVPAPHPAEGVEAEVAR
jgi:hypothetical protein